jgi:hypothetical protein
VRVPQYLATHLHAHCIALIVRHCVLPFTATAAARRSCAWLLQR